MVHSSVYRWKKHSPSVDGRWASRCAKRDPHSSRSRVEGTGPVGSRRSRRRKGGRTGGERSAVASKGARWRWFLVGCWCVSGRSTGIGCCIRSIFPPFPAPEQVCGGQQVQFVASQLWVFLHIFFTCGRRGPLQNRAAAVLLLTEDPLFGGVIDNGYW